MNSAMDCSTVHGNPYSVRRRARTALATGSLSTRTPSLSKMTRSNTRHGYRITRLSRWITSSSTRYPRSRSMSPVFAPRSSVTSRAS